MQQLYLLASYIVPVDMLILDESELQCNEQSIAEQTVKACLTTPGWMTFKT